MKIRLARILRDYIDDAYQGARLGRNGTITRRKGVLAKILAGLESDGDAMRHVDPKGRIAWKATRRLRSYLDDLRADVEADEEEEDM
jgi:hypothetical protein